LRTLGDHIKKRRLDLGLFQKDVGRAIGVDHHTVMIWEQNQRPILAGNIAKVVAFLGYDPYNGGCPLR